MFKQKNPLPRSQLHFPVGNRYCLAGATQYHPDMGGLVIAALRPVRKIIGIFWHKPVEERFQIAARSGIGILHHDDAATRVLNKNSDCPVSHVALFDLLLHTIGDFVKSLSVSAKLKFVMVNAHREWF